MLYSGEWLVFNFALPDCKLIDVRLPLRVKSSLICKLEAEYDNEKAKSLGFKSGPYWDLKWDFVLQTVEEAESEKKKSLPHFYQFQK